MTFESYTYSTRRASMLIGGGSRGGWRRLMAPAQALPHARAPVAGPAAARRRQRSGPAALTCVHLVVADYWLQGHAEKRPQRTVNVGHQQPAALHSSLYLAFERSCRRPAPRPWHADPQTCSPLNWLTVRFGATGQRGGRPHAVCATRSSDAGAPPSPTRCVAPACLSERAAPAAQRAAAPAAPTELFLLVIRGAMTATGAFQGGWASLWTCSHNAQKPGAAWGSGPGAC